jgi:hypothetical protein
VTSTNGAGQGRGLEQGEGGRGVEGAFVKTSYELLKIIIRLGGLIGLDHGQTLADRTNPGPSFQL